MNPIPLCIQLYAIRKEEIILSLFWLEMGIIVIFLNKIVTLFFLMAFFSDLQQIIFKKH